MRCFPFGSFHFTMYAVAPSAQARFCIDAIGSVLQCGLGFDVSMDGRQAHAVCIGEAVHRRPALGLLVDRASGRGVASATFDSVEAMERNKDQLDSIRATGSQEARAEVLDECDFELAVAHLRVPEMV